MTKRLTAIFICVAALAAIVAGCGDSDDSTASTTKAQFTKQANAICTKGGKKVYGDFAKFAREYTKKNGKELGAAQRGIVAESVLIPGFSAEMEELAELAPPSGDEDEITAMLDEFESGIEEGEKEPDTFATGGAASFTRGTEMAKKYGLENCGQIQAL